MVIVLHYVATPKYIAGAFEKEIKQKGRELGGGCVCVCVCGGGGGGGGGGP